METIRYAWMPVLALKKLLRAAWAHRWELWLLIGLSFVGFFVVPPLVGLALERWAPLPLGLSNIDPATVILHLGPAVVSLILLAPFYWWVKGRDRPLLALLWKYALAAEVLFLVVLLTVGPNWPPESWGLLLLLLLPNLLIALGLFAAFGRAASRHGFSAAVLFVLATNFLGALSFTYSLWLTVDSGVTGSILSTLMALATWLYGAVLTLAAARAIRRADSTGVVGWNAVVIPLAALLLFWATEAVVLSALYAWQLGLDSFGEFVQIVWIEFGVVLAGLLMSVGLVYLVRVRNPAVPRSAPA